MAKHSMSSIPVRATKKPLQQQGFQPSGSKKRPQTRPPVQKSTLFAAFVKNQQTNLMTVPYTKAVLYDKSKEWYIYYQYQHPDTGKMVRFKERFNMNRIHDLKERARFAKEALAFINEQLAAGFNPWVDKRRTNGETVVQALDSLLLQLNLHATTTTKATYRLMKRRLTDFLAAEELLAMSIAQVGYTTAVRFQSWMQRKGLSPKTINATTAHLGLFWDAMTDKTDTNPWRKLKLIKEKRNQTSDIYEPVTREEMYTIFDFLNQQYRPFARLALMIYYSWGRTIELCRLRVGDVDLQRNVLHFHAGRTKNNKTAMVQIVQPLRDLLLEMQLQQYPVNFYLFSDGWMPGTKPKKTNEVSERWRELVKGKLGIIKSMYALKHTGNIDYLLQNKGHVDLKWQQMQNRHHSSTMTERYCRQLGAYFVDTDELNFTGF